MVWNYPRRVVPHADAGCGGILRGGHDTIRHAGGIAVDHGIAYRALPAALGRCLMIRRRPFGPVVSRDGDFLSHLGSLD